jgi:hypothetical protein
MRAAAVRCRVTYRLCISRYLLLRADFAPREANQQRLAVLQDTQEHVSIASVDAGQMENESSPGLPVAGACGEAQSPSAGPACDSAGLAATGPSAAGSAAAGGPVLLLSLLQPCCWPAAQG